MTDLVPTTDSWIGVVGPVAQLADHIARTPFVPRAMQNKPEHVAAAILLGREMQLGPMASLRGIDVIEGKPAMTAEMLGARIMQAGHRVEWGESTDKKCTVRITRGDGLSSAEATWTIADAQRAGLAGKTNWKRYPRQMLRHRALTEAAGMACPDVKLGLDAGDNVGDNPVDNPHAQGSDTVTISVPYAESRPESGSETTENLAENQPENVPGTIVADDAPPPHTPAQMRKLRAMLNDVPGGPDEHRELIRELCELPDLASARDLTGEQMSRAIDRLDQLLHADTVDAEVIEE